MLVSAPAHFKGAFMHFLRCFLILLCVFGSCSVSSHAHNRDLNFPTDEEIKLVLTQADRAIQEYKPLLDMEEKMYGKKGEDAVAKDREVVRGIEMAIKGFGKNPQAFNGPLGFSFFEWLDDADRNALLCASGAATEATVNMLAGDKGKAEVEISLSQSCTAVATLFYTVSENAGALYTRFVQNEETIAQQGAEVAKKCTEILKRNGAVPPKK
jgi:hypothetical protein